MTDRAPVIFRFGQRTAEMLMAIAGHSILSNPKFVSNLPPSWGTLHEMTRISEQKLEKLIKDGTINADIQRSDVEAIADEIWGAGLYKFECMAESLNRLVSFMKKWPDHNERIVAECVGEGDHCMPTAELGKLPGWIEKLHRLCVEEEKSWQE